ncbi:MAG: DUF4190 domain-containing protein [Chloroflexota bacterium]
MTTPPQYPAAPSPGDDFGSAPPYAGGYGEPQKRGNGLAVAGMVLGILSVVLFILNALDLVLAVLAIVFSIIGLVRANRGRSGKGMAITGLVLGCVGMVIALVVLVVGLQTRQRCEDHIGHTPTSTELRQCIEDGV